MPKLFLIFFLCINSVELSAQNTLPNVSVKNLGAKVLISWKNAYKVPISNISIQRSYDSLRNFTTIASVLSPQSEENGYLDPEPPYRNMYYRVFVSFEGGSYIYSTSKTPGKDITYKIIKTADGRDSTIVVEDQDEIVQPWQINPLLDSSLIKPPASTTIAQSKLLYNLHDEVILQLPNAAGKIYSVKFYDDKNKIVLQLNDVQESYLIIEKYNFKRSGTYRFEILEDGILIDKNSIVVPKDSKK